jgi:TPP-dependent pyruvate/acetoin dehydrogenase alpha subunit
MTPEQKLNIFRKASLSRKFEDHVFSLIKQNAFKFPLYLSAGQEFISATISEFFKGKSPFIFGQHRAHSTYLSFGGDVKELIDELKGKPSGCAGGMGGSASIQSKKIGMFGHDGLMGTQVPIAVGACFSSNKLTITIAGDAAAEEDYVMAAIAWAGTKKLPIVFVIEDNNLSILTEKKVRRSWEMHDFAKSVNVNAVDVEDKPGLIWNALESNSLPLLLNIRTNRLFWHAGAGIDDPHQQDRYKLEMEEIGEEAKIIDIENKSFVEEMWK